MSLVILLDSSLSMNQSVPLNNNISTSRFNLALNGLNTFLDYQASNNKYDKTAILSFSRSCSVVSNFTRDYKSLKQLLTTVQTFDKTNLINILAEVRRIIFEEWSLHICCNILIITDGNALLQSRISNRNPNLFGEESSCLDLSKCNLPLPYKSKIHIICVTTQNDVTFQRSLSLYKEIISKNSCDNAEVKVNFPSNGGQIWVPNVPILSFQVIDDLFIKLSCDYLKPTEGKIICGSLSCQFELFPSIPINNFKNERDQNKLTIEICGFLNNDEITNPPICSRHFVFPACESLEEFKKWTSFINFKSDLTNEELANMFHEESMQTSFGVLLHGSFKVASMVALCKINISPNCYGILYSGTDNKKKSNLMLSVFPSGVDSVPWIPNIQQFGIQQAGYSETNNKTTSMANTKKMSNYVVWLQQSGIQSDVQKIIRYARKLPDKYELLIAEVKRIKRMAVASRFLELIDIVVKLLERESQLLPSTAHPDTASHINQIIKYLQQKYE